MTKTVCTYCGVISRNQNPGDGCHACQRGYMELERRIVTRRQEVRFTEHTFASCPVSADIED